MMPLARDLIARVRVAWGPIVLEQPAVTASQLACTVYRVLLFLLCRAAHVLGVLEKPHPASHKHEPRMLPPTSPPPLSVAPITMQPKSAALPTRCRPVDANGSPLTQHTHRDRDRQTHTHTRTPGIYFHTANFSLFAPPHPLLYKTCFHLSSGAHASRLFVRQRDGFPMTHPLSLSILACSSPRPSHPRCPARNLPSLLLPRCVLEHFTVEENQHMNTRSGVSKRSNRTPPENPPG